MQEANSQSHSLYYRIIAPRARVGSRAARRGDGGERRRTQNRKKLYLLGKAGARSKNEYSIRAATCRMLRTYSLTKRAPDRTPRMHRTHPIPNTLDPPFLWRLTTTFAHSVLWYTLTAVEL